MNGFFDGKYMGSLVLLIMMAVLVREWSDNIAIML